MGYSRIELKEINTAIEQYDAGRIIEAFEILSSFKSRYRYYDDSLWADNEAEKKVTEKCLSVIIEPMMQQKILRILNEKKSYSALTKIIEMYQSNNWIPLTLVSDYYQKFIANRELFLVGARYIKDKQTLELALDKLVKIANVKQDIEITPEKIDLVISAMHLDKDMMRRTLTSLRLRSDASIWKFRNDIRKIASIEQWNLFELLLSDVFSPNSEFAIAYNIIHGKKNEFKKESTKNPTLLGKKLQSVINMGVSDDELLKINQYLNNSRVLSETALSDVYNRIAEILKCYKETHDIKSCGENLRKEKIPTKTLWKFKYSGFLNPLDIELYNELLSYILRKNLGRFTVIHKILVDTPNYMNSLFEEHLSPRFLNSMIDDVIKYGINENELLKLNAFLENYSSYCEHTANMMNNYYSTHDYGRKIKFPAESLRRYEYLYFSADVVNEYLRLKSPNVQTYVDSIGISLQDFYECLERVTREKGAKYSKYAEVEKKLNIEKIEEKEQLTVIARKIIDGIKNNIIISDNTTRPFDLLDYYEQTSYSFEELYNIVASELTPEETGIITTFMDENFMASKQDVRQSAIYRTKMIFGTREITDEEKKNILDYFKSKNIPLLEKTFSIALRRYLTGYLTFEDDDSIGQVGRHI